MDFFCFILGFVCAYAQWDNWDGITFECPAGKDCVVICDTNYRYSYPDPKPSYHDSSCYQGTINATHASSLTIRCSYDGVKNSRGACGGLTIYCPNATTSKTCKLSCNSYQCHATKIIYPQPQNLWVHCYGQYACNGLRISGPQTYSITSVANNAHAYIQCGYTSHQPQYLTPPVGCTGSIFDLKYISTVTIYCFNLYGPSIGACYSNQIDVRYAKNVDISCGFYDCWYTIINATHVSDSITVNCVANKACQNSHIYAVEANHININCGDDDGSCQKMQLYPNSHSKNKLSITCIYPWFVPPIDNGCSMEIYVSDNYAIDFMDITKDYKYDINLTGTVTCDTKGTQKLSWNATLKSYRCIGHLYCCPYTYAGHTFLPTYMTTMLPSMYPSVIPTRKPTNEPTNHPSEEPSIEPTAIPTRKPTNEPTNHPSEEPSIEPTAIPTVISTVISTTNPTMFPFINPSSGTSTDPTAHLSILPTISVIDPSIVMNSSSAQSTPNGKTSNSTIYTFVAGMLGLVLGVFVVIVVCICYKRKKKNIMAETELAAAVEMSKTNTTNAVELVQKPILNMNKGRKYSQLQ